MHVYYSTITDWEKWICLLADNQPYFLGLINKDFKFQIIRICCTFAKVYMIQTNVPIDTPIVLNICILLESFFLL